MQTSGSFSLRDVPEDWTEAGKHESTDGPQMLTRRTEVRTKRRNDPVDLLTALIAALALAVGVGSTWYLFEVNDVTSSPLLALAAGGFIALGVRLGGGAGDPDIRASVSFIFYMTTVFAVAYLVERHNLGAVREGSPELSDIERRVMHHWLSKPGVLLSWVGGLAVSTQISYITRGRRQ